MDNEFDKMREAILTYDNPEERALELAMNESQFIVEQDNVKRIFLQLLFLSSEFQNWLNS